MKKIQQLWRDLNTGATHLVKLDSQVHVKNNGSLNPTFIPDFSGFYNSKERLKRAKAVPSLLPDIPAYLNKKASK